MTNIQCTVVNQLAPYLLDVSALPGLECNLRKEMADAARCRDAERLKRFVEIGHDVCTRLECKVRVQG